MLTKLVLKNFQIYEKLVIEFDKTFTIVSGPNDSGKSSIVRALYWLFYNEPSGNWMCRVDDQGNECLCEVKAVFDDGNIIKRIKGGTINKYIINDQEFENFGYAIPEAVLEVLKVHPYRTNKEEFKLHIAMQDEKAFLLHETAPVRASVIDTLTGVSILQKTITAFNKETLAVTERNKIINSRIEDNKKQLTSMPDLIKAEDLLKKAINKNQKYKNISEQIDHLHSIIVRLKDAKEKVKCTIIPDISKIKDLKEKYLKSEERLSVLKMYRDRLIKFKVKCGNVYDITSLINLNKQYTVIEQYLQTVRGLYNKLKDNIDLARNSANKIVGLEIELNQVKKELGVCPTCGREWSV